MKNSPTHFRQRRCRFRRGLLAGMLLLPLMLADRGFALDPSRSLQQYNCRTWSRQNGLPISDVNALAQTQDGYLWLGTQDGWVRFDGVEFELPDLSQIGGLWSGKVTSLASAHDGGLWIGLEYGGFGFYNQRSFSIQETQTVGKANFDVRALTEGDDGTLWLGTEYGPFRLTPTGTFESLMSTNPFSGTNDLPNVLCVYGDREGRIWFGTVNNGIYYWKAGQMVNLRDPELEATTIESIAEDPQGQIWVGAINGLYCFDASLRRKKIPPLTNPIYSLLVDRQGTLWIGTGISGVGRYRNGAYEFFGKTDGLTDNYVNALLEDREGSLWIGTRDGVSQLMDVKFPIQQAAEDPAVKDALSVSPSRHGGVWISSSGGVTYFDGTDKTYSTETGMPDSYVKRALEASNGDLYLVCGLKMLTILSPEKKIVAIYTNSDFVVGLAEDARGVVVSVGGELYRAGTNYFRPYAYNNGESPPMWWIINLATGRDGAIWASTVNGIFRVKDGDVQHWSVTEGLANPRVNWVCEDSDGIVWGGTQDGIVRIKNNQVRLINRIHGLFDDNIYAIIPDDLGDLWVDSGRGIFSVSRQSMNDFADGRSDHVSCRAYDGLDSVMAASKTVQEPSGCKTPDGRIWFPSPDGVVIIDPAHIPTNHIAPPVHIDRVITNGKVAPSAGSLIVPPGRGDMEFDFNALSFIAPREIDYRYQLEGYDDTWVDAGVRRQATYTNLKPGTYHFRVIAANADGVWNEQGDTMAIVLLPHYYQTIWFRLFCGGLAFAALFGVYSQRMRHLRLERQAMQKNRDLLEAEVASRTRELAAANASLKREEVQLTQKTQALETEIEERKRMELENERIHGELLVKSRQAGMAEIATNVLHNIGNVLNSVNVSASLVVDNVKQSRAASLAKVAAMLREHERDLGTFITADPKGRQLPGYLGQLAEQLLADQTTTVQELELLLKNIEHIKDVVTMQQSYARVSAVKEIISVRDLVEDSLRMNADSLNRHQVKVIREFDDVPPLNLEKHKILQVLMNLIRNARHACDESGREDKQIKMRVTHGEGRIKISVMDNGVGIPPENLTRIFSHGFTTRKHGHGFGLHSGALAAKEMGGSLTVHSDGIGRGAMFTLELPQITAVGETTFQSRSKPVPAKPSPKDSHE